MASEPTVVHAAGVTRFRMTGAGAFGTSAQWERKDDDREIARRALNILEDRRLLWMDMRWEVPSDCASSASKVRDQLTDLLNNPEIGDGLARQLKAMQRLFRDFMNACARDGMPEPRSWGPDTFSVALGELRTKVGFHVGELAARYDLDVSDELSRIVPDEDGWFFERFGPA